MPDIQRQIVEKGHFKWQSIAKKTLFKAGIRISAAIVVITIIIYFYVAGAFENQALDHLEKYVIERCARESEIFSLAEDNHKILLKNISDYLKKTRLKDFNSEFNRLFIKYPDGSWRNRIEGFDGTRQPGVYLSKKIDVTDEIRLRVVAFYELCERYAPAWRSRFQNFYIQHPDGMMILYWPENPDWCHRLSDTFEISAEQYSYVADKAHNKSRLAAWTSLYYDSVSEKWMVSCETPVDINDVHVATIGHDIVLNELMNRALNDCMPDAQNIIFDRDGKLIVHTGLMKKIMAPADRFSIGSSDNEKLHALYTAVLNMKAGQIVTRNPVTGDYIGIGRLSGPAWFFVVELPKKSITGPASRTASLVLLLGAALLVIEIIILFFILRVYIAEPLGKLVGVTNAIAAGEMNAVISDFGDDELGRLAASIGTMREVIVERMNEFHRMVEVQRSVEDALRESEAYNRLLFDDSIVPLVIMEPVNGACIDCNTAAMRVFHCDSREQLIGVTPIDVADLLQYDGSNSAARAAEKINECISRGFVSFEWRHRRPNGEIWDSEVQLMRFYHKNKMLIQSCILDITERKRAAEDLLRNQKQLKDIAANIPGIIYQFYAKADGKRGLSYVSNRSLELLGIDCNSLDSFFEVFMANIAPEHQKAFINSIEESIAQKSVWNFIGKYVKPDGKLIWFRGTAQPSQFENEVIFNGVILDITDQKKFEEELLNLRNYLSNVIDSMPSMIIGIDSRSNITQWNRQAEKETGVLSFDAIGKKLEKVFPRMAGEAEPIDAAIKKCQVMREVKIPWTTNGKTKYEDVTIYPLTDNGVQGAVIRIDDVTEYVRLEELMIQSEKMLTVGGLAAGMAHEINNPLAGIIQNAEVVARRMSDDIEPNIRAAEAAGITMARLRTYMQSRDIGRMIENIRESGKRAAVIVQNMLSFSRKSESLFSIYDVQELLDQAIELARTDYDLKKKYDFKHIKIIRNYSKNHVWVACEAVKIQQVFLNILKNGAESMAGRQGANKPCFTLSSRTEDGMACVEIEDNGPGMNDEIRKHVFEPFYTTKPVGSGTGLGLSISYFIITENHKGRMLVESLPGAGAKFIIYLPLAKGNDEWGKLKY